jgi:hypothetical protein
MRPVTKSIENSATQRAPDEKLSESVKDWGNLDEWQGWPRHRLTSSAAVRDSSEASWWIFLPGFEPFSLVVNGPDARLVAVSGSRAWDMKKLKHEAELFKAALLAGIQYAEGRKAVEFEVTDSASDKALYIYRLLVHDRIISPMPEDQVSEKTIRHRLATWYAHQLPDGHPLLE